MHEMEISLEGLASEDVDRVQRLLETVTDVQNYRTYHRLLSRRAQIGIERMRLLRTENINLVEENSRLSREVEALSTELARLQDQASLDPLTGLRNRRSLDSALRTEWARMGRLGDSLAVAFVDLDHFKAVNDTWRHSAGDKLLRDLGAQFRISLRRAGDVVGRYGGDEFMFVLPSMDVREAASYLETIRQKIADIDYKLAGDEYHVSLSIGVAAAVPRAGGESLKDLVERADSAAYAAKDSGRGRVVMSDGDRLARVTSLESREKNAAAPARKGRS